MSQSQTQLLPDLAMTPAASWLSDGQEAPALSRTADVKESLNAVLEHIYPSQNQDTLLVKARQIMGDDVSALTDTELEKYVTGFQSMIESWLDEYEREVFDGSTLRQVLGGR